jgi:hypothetical protein
MNFATIADRVRSDFEAMPSLELTLGQAVRVWNLGADDCRYVVDALVDAGFLRWTARRTISRVDRDIRRSETERSHISVRRSKQPDTHV